ncbi:extracellular matrix regulator RemB [Thermoanaerobacterium sp. DL9XJH110]|uniref:extracellular matrix regulator RemB n=1 Tax=Thermoanaerobacterium sp. DL9XJH110 TaxID=3386643 RepID=UPI003BB5E9F9
MFIHIGNDEVVLTKDVIMILDRYSVMSKDTSDFLQVAREEGFIVNDDSADKKSIIISDKKVYFSPISSLTLLKRSNFVKNL